MPIWNSRRPRRAMKALGRISQRKASLAKASLAKTLAHYAGIFGELLEKNYLALPCTYQRCYQGQRHIFKANLRKGLPRRLDYIAVPRTWLAAITKSFVLEHFDAFTLICDHKPVAIEIKGSLMSRAVLSTIPRLDKRWTQSRVQEELGQAVRYAEMQHVPHWSMDQHVHRR